jgi:uncharacterized protein YdiU (UPF0061 family)
MANGSGDGLRLDLDGWFARDLPELCVPWPPGGAVEPALVLLNEQLASDLGLDLDALAHPTGVAVLCGDAVPAGANPVAQAYAGHQFGGYSPRLGDGRALLLGELTTPDGRRVDVQLKGSGRTPFARGGDGRAALGPMLREYLISEAMAALNIPTTRVLSVGTTGESVRREEILPGAVLARVATSHLRVGTFQYAASLGDPDVVKRLVTHAATRHHPGALDADDPALALLDAVVEVQADLVARWSAVGFIHGVLNTDNVTISGETIDYGPCAFMDRHDPTTVFSSIDHGGRYAFGNQPSITLWNLARLAEALLGAMAGEVDVNVASATEVLETFPDRYRRQLHDRYAAKVGLVATGDRPAGPVPSAVVGELVDDLSAAMTSARVDHTTFFRHLGRAVAGDDRPLVDIVGDDVALLDWLDRWRTLRSADRRPAEVVAAAMDDVNPLYVPRNHLVEEALAAAGDGNLGPCTDLLDALADPFTQRPRLERYAEPAPSSFGPYRTFCGT